MIRAATPAPTPPIINISIVTVLVPFVARTATSVACIAYDGPEVNRSCVGQAFTSDSASQSELSSSLIKSYSLGYSGRQLNKAAHASP